MAISKQSESEIRKNDSATKLNTVNAERAEVQLGIDKVELLQSMDEYESDHYKHKIEQSYDLKNGYIVFDDDVDETSLMKYSATLRSYDRMNPKAPLTLELNTRGGCIISGFALFDELLRFRSNGHHLTIRVRGQAASMGGVLLQAADKREIGPNALVMLHRASFGAIGSAYEVEDTLDFVKKLERRIVDIFANRSGKGREVFEKFFAERKDMWFDANEALEAGLVDGIV